jgi:hypothetical protein
VLEDLWRAMDAGKRFGIRRVLRFNGHFFRNAEALPLTADDIAVLGDSADADWRYVEPSIFGTLLTRALDPAERHRLGAEFTPREYVERVVRQTVDVPLRERWAPVQAHAAELAASRKKKARDAALGELRGFHAWMRGLRFLDPACGSGNFLYVTLHMVKRLELEVLRAIEEITGNPELGIEEVGPWQFHGIELKPWAREIAELTLWIGYHQFWMEHHQGVNPLEPVLKDTGTLEQRDAVLEWDEIIEVPEKSRPDPTPRIVHSVTGKLVPDPNARLPYYEYRGARQAEWPQADFIVGNPPYLGKSRQREALGAGYVDALRNVYPRVPDGADFVMYWWFRAAEEVACGRATRAGLITTNSITQKMHNQIIADAAAAGAKVVWAAPDHPWVDEVGAANVRVAMTIVEASDVPAMRVEVDANGEIVREQRGGALNPDLTFGVDISSASSLLSNVGLSVPGFQPDGAGFILERSEAQALITADPRNSDVIRPYRNGRDLSARSRDLFIVDFGLMTEEEAREYPLVFDRIRDRVKPIRDAGADRLAKEKWWRFARNREELRAALRTLDRYIVTVRTSRRRFFSFLDTSVAPDSKLVTIAIRDAFALGVLSSTLHVEWATAGGGRLGVGNDPSYDKAVSFDPFPFPDPPKHLRERIGLAAEALDQHRKDAIARDERVTMTGMYNGVEKLRSGEALTAKERAVHEIAACGTLLDLHNTLDGLVAQAYGWPWPMEREEVLERLVALHDERVKEEKQGKIRWLRPEYQVPRFGGGEPPSEYQVRRFGDDEPPPEPTLALPKPPPPAPPAAAGKRPWPAGAIEQIGAAKASVAAAPATPAEVADAFAGAPVPLVARHLETLAMVGEVRLLPDGRYEAVTEPL